MKIFYFFLLFLISNSLFSQKEVNLTYNIRNNETYIITTEISSESIQEIASSPQNVSSRQNIIYTLSFAKDKSSSNYSLLLKFKNITSEINQSGYKQIFNSDSSNNKISKIFQNFLTKHLSYQLTEHGKIIPLYSVNKLFADSSENKQKYIFSQSVEQKIKANLPVSIIFPLKPIRIGDSWHVPDTLISGIFNFYNKSYTLDSVSKTEYYITENNDFSSDNNNLIPMNRVFVSYDVKGKTKSNYILNKKSCIIKSAYIKQTGSGNLYMRYTKKSDPAYTWKMTINNIVEFKSKKLITD